MVQAEKSRPRVLLIGDTCGDAAVDAQLRAIADVYTIPRRDYDEAKELIAEAARDHGPFDAFGGMFKLGEGFPMKWDQGLFAPLAPECKVYIGPGAGYDKVDVEWITSTGAYYCNTPQAVGRRTADGAMMLLLAALRGVVMQDVSARKGEWMDMSPEAAFKDQRETTLGIVGLGNIGNHIAKDALALGFPRIIYTSRTRRSNPSTSDFEQVSLDTLLQEADAIVLCCPLTPGTTGLINKDAFGRMKRGAVLVNVSRGPVVDESALVDALEEGIVLRAALDVFETEPSIHPKLLGNHRVILSPHVAAAPGPSFMRMISVELVQALITYLSTGRPKGVVNEDALSKVIKDKDTLPLTQALDRTTV